MLLEAIKNKQRKRAEHKGEVRYREKAELCEAEAKWAKIARPRGQRGFRAKSGKKCWQKEDSFEVHANLAADRPWQACQSNETKKRNLIRDLEDLVAAFDQNGWDKNKEASVKMWVSGKSRGKETISSE